MRNPRNPFRVDYYRIKHNGLWYYFFSGDYRQHSSRYRLAEISHLPGFDRAIKLTVSFDQMASLREKQGIRDDLLSALTMHGHIGIKECL